MTHLYLFLSLCLFPALASANPELAQQHYLEAKQRLNSSSLTEINAGLKELKLAAEAGHIDARLLYFRLTDGEKALEVRPRLAYYWIRELAEDGNSGAQYFQGREYLRGQSVKRDEIEAAVWLSLASQQHHAEASKDLKNLQNNWTEREFLEFKKRLKLRQL
jgi:TPR repeat protein